MRALLGELATRLQRTDWNKAGAQSLADEIIAYCLSNTPIEVRGPLRFVNNSHGPVFQILDNGSENRTIEILRDMRGLDDVGLAELQAEQAVIGPSQSDPAVAAEFPFNRFRSMTRISPDGAENQYVANEKRGTNIASLSSNPYMLDRLNPRAVGTPPVPDIPSDASNPTNPENPFNPGNLRLAQTVPQQTIGKQTFLTDAPGEIAGYGFPVGNTQDYFFTNLVNTAGKNTTLRYSRCVEIVRKFTLTAAMLPPSTTTGTLAENGEEYTLDTTMTTDAGIIGDKVAAFFDCQIHRFRVLGMGLPVLRCRITAINNDTLTCLVVDDGTASSPLLGTTITVAKDCHLQRTPWHGQTFNGITYTYSDSQTRTANNGVTTVTQVVYPAYYVHGSPYTPCAEIYARWVLNKTDVTNVWYIDLNTGARHWVTV